MLVFHVTRLHHVTPQRSVAFFCQKLWAYSAVDLELGNWGYAGYNHSSSMLMWFIHSSWCSCGVQTRTTSPHLVLQNIKTYRNHLITGIPKNRKSNLPCFSSRMFMLFLLICLRLPRLSFCHLYDIWGLEQQRNLCSGVGCMRHASFSGFVGLPAVQCGALVYDS